MFLGNNQGCFAFICLKLTQFMVFSGVRPLRPNMGTRPVNGAGQGGNSDTIAGFSAC